MGTSLIRNITPQDPTVGPCLGPYAGHRGVALSYERGAPVALPVALPPIHVTVGFAICPFIVVVVKTMR